MAYSLPVYGQMLHPSAVAGNEQDLDLNFNFESLDELQELLPAHLRSPLPLATDVLAPEPDSEEGTAFFESFDNSPLIDKKSKTSDTATRIEQFYRQATGARTLKQQGYEFFTQTRNNNPLAAGMVQDSYILGAGDRLNIAFMGERKDKSVYRINRSGQLAIDHLPHIAAAGKSIEALRADIRHLLDAQGYHGDVVVGLEGIRQVSVLVAGHVASPGRHHVNALQTLLEAIEAAGGVQKTGSLRQIRLVRAGKSTTIDLYRVLGLQGGAQILPSLQDGDRIMVPPLGQTVAITGDVRQPGIYELPARGGITAEAGLELAGGALSYGHNRIIMLSPRSDGQRIVSELENSAQTNLKDGVILSVKRGQDKEGASISLVGEVRSPGTYALATHNKLSKLLASTHIYGDDIYPLIGVISRRRSQDLAREMIVFSPQDVFLKKSDLDLKESDQIRVFSRTDITRIMEGKAGHDVPALITGFVREHGVSVQGAVRLAGTWPVAKPSSIQAVLEIAGGATADADITRVELLRNDSGLILASGGSVSRRDVINITEASANSFTLKAGDSVRVPDRFEAVTRQSVTLAGEVLSPGTYDLMRGDTLLSVIERAGGLTDQAYPLGAVFSRAAERKREREKYMAAARDLERSIAMAAKGDDGKVDMAQMALAKELVDELKTIEPAGRITVQADPALLNQDPAQDILLEAGDRIYFPKRPLSVRVTGEVLSPAALQFRADKRPNDYLGEAGGTTHHADKGRIFILFPDGSAQPLAASNWTSVKPVMIIPGSTIVVPRDPKPFSFVDSAKDITQILSNLAITGIYADDLVSRRR